MAVVFWGRAVFSSRGGSCAWSALRHVRRVGRSAVCGMVRSRHLMRGAVRVPGPSLGKARCRLLV